MGVHVWARQASGECLSERLVRSGLEGRNLSLSAFQKFANTLRAHWSGIIHFVESNITNAILESINSKIQLDKRRARGFRNVKNYINIIYFLCGRLTLSYPRYFT